MRLPDSASDNSCSHPHEIVELVSAEANLKLQTLQWLIEPCDRKTYGERLREAARILNCSIRSVQRLVAKWEKDGIAAFAQRKRSDTGEHRVSEEWQKFIVAEYRNGKHTPNQVAVQVKKKAQREQLDSYPSHMTVYRLLAPLIEKKEKPSARSIGWKGSRLDLKTRAGETISIDHSNQVWQCDHTRADILLVDQHGALMERPWLTTVVDTYSRCIVGLKLGFDAPSSQTVALGLRHAILPKKYDDSYKLYHDWLAFGKPEYLYTDGGKDFRSQHLQQIGAQLGFVCELRDRPSGGGIVERPFGTLNTEFFSTLPGYTGRNIQNRPKNAERDARLTLRDLERLLVAYIVNRYNQGLDARMGDQTRIERWQAGLVHPQPHIFVERELDICLMKQARRTVYRGGLLNFENLTYRSSELAAYVGSLVVIRYDPQDITRILVYRRETDQDANGGLATSRETFLATATAQDLEAEQLSLEEAKANSRRIREAGKAIDNQSMLDELHDREAFLEQRKPTRRERQKKEQQLAQPLSKPLKSPEPSEAEVIEESKAGEIPEYEVWSFDDE